MKRWTIPHLRVLPFLLLIFAVGCIAVQELALYQQRPIKFSHAIHLTKAAATCDQCHTDAKSADGIGMPSPAKCVLCHNPKDKEIAAKYLKPFVIEGKMPTWTNATAISKDVKFSHKKHTDKKVDCKECHTGIETSAAVSLDLRVNMKQCMTCHEDRSVSNSCETCHTAIRQTTPPVNHKINWQTAHGPMSRFHNDEAQNQCSLCHTESSCNACHQSTTPKTHNEFWKQRGHGVSASIDREACQTCHKEDSCQRCHENTAPRTHSAAWMAPRDTHCLSCHEPLNRGTDSCAVCHTGTPSHNLAANKPAWHTPAMNCRQCHGPGLSQPLPHADNGDNCNACHH
ncbi:MAG TPA: cytochrome c3 family protein [Planctomycetota bacterium]|nr:cytochrome c3 family protein [Planctomycetota bacterium]